MTDHMSAAEYRRQVTSQAEPAENPYKLIMPFSKRLSMLKGGQSPVKPARKHEEDDLTIQVAEYCELLLLQKKITAFSHIPQETFTKSWGVKRKNTAMGVRSGVPDMLIVYPTKVLFLELKKEKGGVVSPAQDQWLQALRGTGKVFAAVARGWTEAERVINGLLE